LVGAGDLVLAARDLPGALAGGLGDLRLETAGVERLGQPAFRLDGLELAPAALAKTLGQRFEAAGAAGGIVDDMEVGFVLQDELRVAREAAGEGVRRA